MLTHEELLEAVLAHEYDPQKRREYYLRTRQLKGREQGATLVTSGGSSSDQKDSLKVDKPSKPKVDYQARAEALNKRLDRLREVLRELVKQAKERSGVDTSKDSKKSSSSEKKDSKPDKPKTAAEKRKDAEKAKERREKEDPTPKQQTESVEKQIAAVREKIKQMRQQLADAKKKVDSNKSAGSAGASLEIKR